MAYAIPFYGYTTSRFGETAGRTNPHRGHDVAPGGQDFPSWVNGTVVVAGWQSCLGNRVVVRNDVDGYYIGVSHLANIKVSVGQRVGVGTALGNIGNTGSCSAGRHAHITVSPSSPYPESGPVINPVTYAASGSPGGGGGTGVGGYGYGLTSGAQLSLQRAMSHTGRYTGPHDGEFGPSSVAGMQQWLKDLGYLPSTYTVDGEPGATYGAALQSLARDKGGYTGAIDGAPGSKTSEALVTWAEGVVAGSGSGTPAPSGIDWKAWQTFLQAYGYNGVVDGEPGVRTYEALQRFLAEKFGYTGPVDGEPGDKTWEAFKKAVAAGYPSAGTGSGGTNVDWTKWQTLLRGWGYDGPVDGDPGPATYTALQKFLTEKFGYTGPIDGDPGNMTWEAMARAIVAGYPEKGLGTTSPTPEPPTPDTGIYKSFGIDVATTQKDINLSKAKAEGVQFVIVKMGGLNVSPQYVAPYYKKQVDATREQGLYLGHYYLIGQPKNASGVEDAFYSPEQQADYFVDNLYNFDVNQDVLALDNERLDANGAFWEQDKVVRFIDQLIKRTGISASRIWVYAGAADWRGHQPWDKVEAKGVKIWWAAYGSYPTGHLPDHEASLQGSVTEAHIHQYSSKAFVAGYSLDGNVSKYTVDQLFAKGTVVTPPVEPEEPTTPVEPTDPVDPTDPSIPDTGIDLTAEDVAAITAALEDIQNGLGAISNVLKDATGTE